MQFRTNKNGKAHPITQKRFFTTKNSAAVFPLQDKNSATGVATALMESFKNKTDANEQLRIKRVLVSAANKAKASGHPEVAEVYENAYKQMTIVKPTTLQRGHSVAGTSLQGYLEGVTYDQLKAKYGEPYSDGTWCLKLGVNETMTIYAADEDMKHLNKVTKWHIGGWKENNENVLKTIRKDTKDLKGSKVKDAYAQWKKPKNGWLTQKVPESWKKDYGTVAAWKNKNDYIQIKKIDENDKFRQSLYNEGFRFEIASNRFSTSHHKTLPEAKTYAKESMKATFDAEPSDGAMPESGTIPRDYSDRFR